MPFDVITFGSAAKDIIVNPKKLTMLKYEKDGDNANVCFPLGSKIDVDQIDFYSGGGGTNAAATFANQSFKTAFCGVVGEDNAGKEIVMDLEQRKIDTAFVKTTKEKKTNHSVIILNNGYDRTILAYRGASELLEEKDIPFTELRTKWLYFAPLSGLLCDSFEVLVNWAADNKIKVAANPGMAQLSLPNFAQIAKKIDVLILNQEEASFLTKIPKENTEAIFQKIDEICPGITIMTRGAKGVMVSDGKMLYSAEPLKDRVVLDTTGAGDALGSGFVAEYTRSQNIEQAIQFGLANSKGCIAQMGAQTGLLKKGKPFEKVEVKKENIV